MPRTKVTVIECPKCHSENTTYNYWEKSIHCKDCNTYSIVQMDYKSCVVCEEFYFGTILDDRCPNCTRLKRKIEKK